MQTMEALSTFGENYIFVLLYEKTDHLKFLSGISFFLAKDTPYLAMFLTERTSRTREQLTIIFMNYLRSHYKLLQFLLSEMI